MDPREREWWPVAEFANKIGLNVVVCDPEAERVEEFYDGVDGHGTTTLVPYPGTGWDLKVSEAEAEIDPEVVPDE